MDKKQQQALSKYADSLAQLITRLSAFFEGSNPAIDNELKILRGHLAGQPNFTLAEVSIQKLTPLLMDGDKQLKKRITSNITDLKSKLKKIQQIDGASEPFRKETAKLLSSLSLPTTTLAESYQHFFSAIALFHTAFSDNPGTRKAAYQPAAEPQTSSDVKTEILTELQQLVDVYAKKKPQDPQLLVLKDMLDKGLSEKQLLESCLLLIRLIISETMLDASANGKVVQSIYLAVATANKKAEQSVNLSKEHFTKQSQQQNQLHDMLGELDSDLHADEDVDALKNKAHHHINQIRQELETQQKAGKKDQHALMNLLTDMQAQMQSLQEQTQSYKKRLVEQRASIYTDPLTKVSNRLAYNERITKSLAQSKALNEPLCLAVIDIDHFKKINDQYGHAAGDRTLQVIAKHIKKDTHPNEFLARWGGEEFVLLMHNQPLEGLFNRLDELRESLSELPFKFKQTPVKITASFGASCHLASESSQQFFDRADKALYAAKNQGRNRVIVSEYFTE